MCTFVGVRARACCWCWRTRTARPAACTRTRCAAGPTRYTPPSSCPTRYVNTYLLTPPTWPHFLFIQTNYLTTLRTWPYCLPNHTNYLTTLPTSLHYLHDYTSYLTTLPTWPTFIHALSIYTSFCYCPITRYPIRGNRPQSKYTSRSFLFGYVIIPIYGYFPIIHPINLLDVFVFVF